jgi:Transposase Tn5 dimerisation domain/Transposase DNA-binding
MQEWIADELATLDLGDVRLDQRCHAVLDRLSAKPSVSIPAACVGLAEIAATYRFFDNDRVDDSELLHPHRDATVARIRQERVVLIPQDTTEFDYTRPEEVVAGAGPLTSETRLGFHNHVHLALTPQRLCLGVVDADIWGRDLDDFGKRLDKASKPIEQKESYRWLQGYRRACEIAELASTTQIVSISDAEGDIYECFLASLPEPGQRKADWIIRAGQDRRLAKESRSEDGEIRKLRQAVTATPVLGKIGLEVSKKMGRKARTAAMTVQSVTVHLQPPERRTDPPQQLDSIAINAVLIREIEPPPGEEAIEWLLLTNLPVDTFAQAVTVAEYYACRWQVEIFFKVLKSGCRVEKLQLETEDRLKPCLMLYMIVAWRILFVTMLGRECPELPCDVVFAEEEWKSVWAIVKRRPTPMQPPSLAEFLKIVAGLGGHLGRKGDGPPGPQTMWIGLQRTIDFAMAWMAFGPDAARVKCTQ